MIILLICLICIKIISSYDIKISDYCDYTCMPAHGRPRMNFFCMITNYHQKESECVVYKMKDDDRLALLYFFNHKRNKFARGGVRVECKARDMRLINYDMELEYLARSTARFCKRPLNDYELSCMLTESLGVTAAIAVVPIRYVNFSINSDNFRKAMKLFWNPPIKFLYDFCHDNLKDNVSHTYYNKTIPKILWSQHDYVGCTMAMGFDLIVICFLGSKNTDRPPLYWGEMFFKPGRPCTRCPPGRENQCETDTFPSLCGTFMNMEEVKHRWESRIWADGSSKRRHQGKKRVTSDSTNITVSLTFLVNIMLCFIYRYLHIV